MNAIINKFLLTGDKFIPAMHLKQRGFTYSAFRSITKSKERIQKFKEKELQIKFYEIEHFLLPKNPKYDEYQRGLASMVYNFFDKKSKGSGIDISQNEQLADELYKPYCQLISRFNKGFRLLLLRVIDILVNMHGLFL